MKKIVLILTTVLVSAKLFEGTSLAAARQNTRCTDGWTAFKDEKCLLISFQSGLQTQEDAAIVCEAYTNKSYNIPQLLTVKSYEEQEFVHHFLFDKNKVIDHVWLGLKESWNNGTMVFEWNDGSDIYFTNWAEQNVSDGHHQCVQMESGEGNDPPGIWVKVNCQKRNTVVCEKLQAWSFEKLQTTILSLKLQLHHTIAEHSKTKNEFKAFKESAEEELQSLKGKSDGLPIGSIYVQLGGQAAPADLWPSAIWKEVSSSYAGLFFRVVGGPAGQFGVTQSDNSPRLTNVEWRQAAASTNSPAVAAVSADGNWSNYVYTGTSYSGTTNGVRFQVSSDEVRPPNQAVKIWLRIR